MKHLWDVECMTCGRVDWVRAVPYIAKETYGYGEMVCSCGAIGQSLSMFKPNSNRVKEFMNVLAGYGIAREGK